MSSSESSVSCSTHGDAYTTFVCRYLISRPKQRWISGYPSKRNPWPEFSLACEGMVLSGRQ